MRKISLIFVLSLVFVFAVSSVAIATPTSGPHGNYTSNTALCAACHLTHTAPSAHLIAFSLGAGTNLVYKTCTYCHNGASPGSKYDEVNGQIKDGPTNLWGTLGGGFQNMATIEGTNTVAATMAVTSKHKVDQLDGTMVSIPGNNTTNGGKIELTCASCHDPHGTSNSRQLMTSFKNLNLDGSTFTTVPTAGVVIAITAPLQNETATYNNSISNFCGGCHVDYKQSTAGSGSVPTGTYIPGRYRHRVAESGTTMPASLASGYKAGFLALPISTSVPGDVICNTCHYAHGTTAAVAPGTYAGGSTLLRMDERGVCQNCHNKTPDSTTPTVLPNPTSYQAIDKTHIVVTFSTYVEKVSATTSTNYTVNGGQTVSAVTIPVLQPNGTLGKQVLVTLTTTPVTTTPYIVTVTGVKDLNGNIIAGTNTFNFTGK